MFWGQVQYKGKARNVSCKNIYKKYGHIKSVLVSEVIYVLRLNNTT